jgi:Zn-dependent peptidase ImmA (M78 family)
MSRADHHAIRHLTVGIGRGEVSAVTIYVDDYRRVILFNPAQASTRMVSSLGHELSHVVLEHEPERPLVSGRREWDGMQEEEASWLAGCLLIPQEAALAAARQGMTDGDVSEAFGTSLALARMRMNGTGVRRQAGHESAARQRRWRR